ncbi:MAG: tRNA (guanosine(37)-N1)-methyltransferase TrmD [Bdellovibrionota bacterium]|nr:tRNA (guanosine(37)-N1)-methyltransferase TrmD [Bdellovibrionota bacterium]
MKKTHKIWIISLFPDFFESFLETGLAGQALRGKRGVDLSVELVQLRDFSESSYKGVDDAPYGGGPGMVMRPDILKRAFLEGVIEKGQYGEDYKDKLHVVFPGPRGKRWNQEVCVDFSKRIWGEESKDLVFICGRYEGVDERFIQNYVDEEISLGDYVLTGGELAVMAIIDSAIRFLPGVLGNRESFEKESFNGGLLEHPQYTRPRTFEGVEVPEVLLSGHHKKIEAFEKAESLRITKTYRPDLLEKE